jgi:hypothetical protein
MRTKPLLLITLLVMASIFSACDKTKSLQTYPGLKAWHDAIKSKDMAAYQKTRIGYMFMNGMQLAGGEWLDKSVLESADIQKAHADEDITLRNEKITHDDKIKMDVASVEWKDANGKWWTIQLLKEDGVWKFYRFIMDK